MSREFGPKIKGVVSGISDKLNCFRTEKSDTELKRKRMHNELFSKTVIILFVNNATSFKGLGNSNRQILQDYQEKTERINNLPLK